MSTTNNKNLGHATAYGYAKSKGYTGTEEEFAELMASYADVGQTAVDAALAAQTAKGKAEDAQEAAESAKTAAASSKTAAQTAQAAAEQAAREALAGAGTPLVAQTADAMTDQTKIYVYLGSETGYTSGNWYYFDGSAWTSGGVYNAVAVDTDAELSPKELIRVFPSVFTSGQAADSRTVAYGLMGGMDDRVNLDLEPYKTKWFIKADGNWTKYGNSSPVYSYIIDLSGIYRLDITAQAVNRTRLFFLTDFAPAQNAAAPVSSVFSAAQGWADAKRTYFVPPDANYAWVKGVGNDKNDCTPTITINRVKSNTDAGFSKPHTAAEAKATGDAVSRGVDLAADTGNANIGALLAVAKTYFDNRTTSLGGAQSMLYHDGNTILDDTTAHTANIDCSTFVTLCLRALAYADTSYSHVLSTAAAPEDWKDNPDSYWSINPFDWDASHLESGANPHPVRYAAAVARWMEDHGYEVQLFADKRNIRPGDILFFARHASAGGAYVNPTFYKKINHIGICYSAQTTPRYDVVESMSAMSDTSKRYVYDGDWYYYQNEEWQNGGAYVDPDEFPITHEMIHCAADEANTDRFIPPYPTFVSSSADIGSSSQGGGHGSVFIEALESRRGDAVNGIDTLCMVCRPIPGSLWAEKIDARLRALETALAALQG